MQKNFSKLHLLNLKEIYEVILGHINMFEFTLIALTVDCTLSLNCRDRKTGRQKKKTVWWINEFIFYPNSIIYNLVLKRYDAFTNLNISSETDLYKVLKMLK